MKPVEPFKLTRVVMRPSSASLNGMRELGRYNYTAAQVALHRHQHSGCVEICHLVKGRQTYRVGGKYHTLRGGDVFVTFPNETHGTGGLPEEKGILYWMILEMPAENAPFIGLPVAEGKSLARALRRLPRRHFRGSPKLKLELDAFTRCYHQPGGALRTCRMAHHAVAFLLEVINCETKAEAPAGVDNLVPVVDHIHAHLGESLAIPVLAELAGLSEVRFKIRFKEAMGVPPGEYVQRARVEEAKRRLAKGDTPVTRIAFDLGFSSSQYFATVFKRFTGKRPSGI